MYKIQKNKVIFLKTLVFYFHYHGELSKIFARLYQFSLHLFRNFICRKEVENDYIQHDRGVSRGLLVAVNPQKIICRQGNLAAEGSDPPDPLP